MYGVINMKTEKERASSVEDWEEYYGSRGEPMFHLVDLTDFRYFSHKLLIDKINTFINTGEGALLSNLNEFLDMIDVKKKMDSA